MGGKLTFQSMSHHEMFCSSIGFFEILKSRFGDLGGVEEGWVGVGVVEFVMMMIIVVVVVVIIMIIGVIIIIVVVVVVVVFFGFICVVVLVLQIQIPHRRSRIKSRRCCCSRPCFPTSQIPMIRKRFRNVRGSLRTVGTGCIGFLLIGFVAVAAAAAVQRNSSLVALNTSSSSTTHHRAAHVSLLSLIGNFQLTNRNRRAIRNTSKAQSEHRFTFSRAGSRTFLG